MAQRNLSFRKVHFFSLYFREGWGGPDEHESGALSWVMLMPILLDKQ